MHVAKPRTPNPELRTPNPDGQPPILNFGLVVGPPFSILVPKIQNICPCQLLFFTFYILRSLACHSPLNLVLSGVRARRWRAQLVLSSSCPCQCLQHVAVALQLQLQDMYVDLG